VLDISNREENKGLFEKEDELINKDLDEVKKQWEAQRKQLDMNKRLKENYSDFDYFAANADW
jgi:ribosome-binding ATPase YchF (GTP1/OBG family)